MLAASSKRAFSSTTAVTDLPASTASFSALHDRAVARGSIERPLDGHDVRVGDRLAQVLHDDVEALVGVVDDDVLLADGGEAVAVEFADALGKADVEGLEFQIRPVGHDELGGVGQPEQALFDEDRVLADLEFLA